MKIIYLNCWHGKLEDKIIDFLVLHSKTTDIFCLQEVPTLLGNKVEKKLKNFFKVENRSSTNIYSNRLVIFIRKIIDFETKKNHFIQLYIKKYSLSVINVHGISLPGHKRDTKERVKFSKEIIEFCKKSKNVVIGGDFNLMPRTKSIKIIEQNGFVNLIRKHNIKKTRNIHAWNQAKEIEKGLGHKFYGKQKFSDYCFVSKDIKVKSFEVPNVEISDHLPLILEFEV